MMKDTQTEVTTEKKNLAEKRISDARARMLATQQFFGVIGLELNLVLRTDLPFKTMGVDGKNLFYDPDFVLGEAIENVRGVVLHEVLHVALDHLVRVEGRDFSLWNQAADYSINSIVLDQPGMGLPEGALYRPEFRGLTAEVIYDRLLQEQKDEQEKKDNEDSDDDSESGDEGGGEGSDSQAPGQGEAPGEGKGEPEWRDYHGEVKGDDIDEMRAKVESAFDNLSSEEQGKVPGDIRRLIDKRRSQVDWREYLRATTIDVMAREDYSYKRPSRRSHGAGCYLPSLIGETNTKLMVIVDTSASVGKEDLDQFCAEIDAVKEYADRTDVVSVDTRVHYPIDTIGKGDSIAESVKPRGGGGTSFDAPFEDINAGKLESPEMAIYLTDGYCSFPKQQPSFPVLWVVTRNGCDLANIPWGMKLRLD